MKDIETQLLNEIIDDLKKFVQYNIKQIIQRSIVGSPRRYDKLRPRCML